MLFIIIVDSLTFYTKIAEIYQNMTQLALLSLNKINNIFIISKNVSVKLN